MARVELGAQSYDQYSVRTGRPAASVLIYQLPGSNALDVSREVREATERLSRQFPEDLEYAIPSTRPSSCGRRSTRCTRR